MQTAYLLGVDLGGTKLHAVLLESCRPDLASFRGGTAGDDGRAAQDLEALLSAPIPSPEALVSLPEGVRQLDERRFDTEQERGYDHIASLVCRAISELEQEVPPDHRPGLRVGVGLPGHISRRTGKVKNANTTCLNGQDLWGEVVRRVGRPVAFDNDANCLTLAEATWGAARGGRMVFGVILGTGVGGGLAVHGQVWPGLQGIAGEWGHITLEPGGRPCYCGRRGCVETYLSGPGLARSLREEAACALSARELNAALKAGQGLPAEVEAVVSSYLERFGRALSLVVNALDPDVVVMGGGVSRLAPLYTRGREALARNIFNDELLTRLVPATLGDAGGVYGAALIGVPRG